MKYKMYFSDSRDRRREIADVQNMEEAFAAIKEFCDARNFRIYYTRFCIIPQGVETEFGISDRWVINFDVGSWSKFFLIYFDTEQEAHQFLDTMK